MAEIQGYECVMQVIYLWQAGQQTWLGGDENAFYMRERQQMDLLTSDAFRGHKVTFIP